MPQRKVPAVFLMLCALNAPILAQTHPGSRLTIASSRHAEDDLEVTGMIAGLPAGAIGYVSYAELAALPQITTTIQNDSNFEDEM